MLYIAQLSSLQTQPSQGASQPTSPHLHPWTSSPACLLLSFSSPLFPWFLNTRQPTPPPLLAFLPSFCLPFSSPGSTLNHRHPPPSAMPSQPPFQWKHNLPPSAVGGLPLGWGGVKTRAAPMHTQFNHKNTPHTHKPPPYVCLCVYTSAEGHRNMVGDGKGVGDLGGVLMALSAGNALMLHRQLQNQLSSWVTSLYSICIGKAQTFMYIWDG